MKQEYRHTKPYRGKQSSNITWDDVPTQAMRDDEDTAKCYSCNGWFPVSSCVLNTEDDGTAVPVCERCASGRVA
jgi:hypothetical protein